MNAVLYLWNKAIAIAVRISWAGPLLARAAIGVMFAVSGWGKLSDIDKVIAFFGDDLGLPAPAFQAHLVGYTEFLGGIAVVLGLGTRLFAIPLACTMAVAMGSGGAFDEPPTGIIDVVGKEEFIYMGVMLWLALAGAGKASVDAVIAKAVAARTGRVNAA